MSMTEAAEIMADADDNCNAAIDFEEFKSYCRKIDGYARLTEPKTELAEAAEAVPTLGFNTIAMDPAILEKKCSVLDVVQKTLRQTSKEEENAGIVEENKEEKGNEGDNEKVSEMIDGVGPMVEKVKANENVVEENEYEEQEIQEDSDREKDMFEEREAMGIEIAKKKEINKEMAVKEGEDKKTTEEDAEKVKEETSENVVEKSSGDQLKGDTTDRLFVPKPANEISDSASLR